jgi:4-nitrophenyl phosphatase
MNLSDIDTLLIDCDGVLWMEGKLLPNVHQTISTLKSLGKQLLFVTNNSTNSRSSYLKKFTSLGLETTKEEIFGSAYAAACYLDRNLDKNKRVYVVGMDGICDELKEFGIQHAESKDDHENLKTMSDMSSIQMDDSIGAVLVGFDLDINYKKLAKAFTYAKYNPGCLFLATNDDLTFPAGQRVCPGNFIKV